MLFEASSGGRAPSKEPSGTSTLCCEPVGVVGWVSLGGPKGLAGWLAVVLVSSPHQIVRTSTSTSKSSW
jgi:hypothetical protein